MLLKEYKLIFLKIIFLSGVTVEQKLQKYTYDWTKILKNTNDAVSYQIDTDNNGTYDFSSNFSPVPKSLNERGSISGYVKGDTNASMAGWKFFLDLNGDGILQENNEQFTVTDSEGFCRFDNLERGSYKIIEIPHQIWNLIKSAKKKYDFYLNNGQNVVNLNFENTFVKGKTK